MEKSKMQLVDYVVNELKIEKNFEFNSSNESIMMNPEIGNKIEKIDKDTVAVSLRVIIHKSKKKPFSTCVEIMGIFKLENWENEENTSLVRKNAMMILFPYLRSNLSSLTNLAGFTPYILPTFDVTNVDDCVKQGENSSNIK